MVGTRAVSAVPNGTVAVMLLPLIAAVTAGVSPANEKAEMAFSALLGTAYSLQAQNNTAPTINAAKKRKRECVFIVCAYQGRHRWFEIKFKSVTINKRKFTSISCIGAISAGFFDKIALGIDLDCRNLLDPI